MSGTSVAAPHAAGAAALYIAAHSRATNAAGVYAIRQALINSAQAQSAWNSANTQDPDVNHEGLVSVATIAPPSNNNPPVVTLTSPTSGSTYASNARIQFTATARDTEDGDLTTGLVWMSNTIWQIGTGGSFSVLLVPGTHTVVASVTDSGGKTASATVVVTVNPNSAPVVTISTPTGNSSFNSGSAVSFTGSATDTEQGILTPNLVWNSSINGVIGNGGSFSKSNLSAGTHTITATATDSAGATGQASISITVASTPQPQNTLTVAVVTDKSSYVSGNRVYFTATVTDGVNRVSGVAARLTLVTANGRQVVYNATTDSNGRAKFQYKINSGRDGVGTWRGTVVGTKTGYNSGSGTATFQVTR
jgi:hypothetical protein